MISCLFTAVHRGEKERTERKTEKSGHHRSRSRERYRDRGREDRSRHKHKPPPSQHKGTT